MGGGRAFALMDGDSQCVPEREMEDFRRKNDAKLFVSNGYDYVQNLL